MYKKYITSLAPFYLLMHFIRGEKCVFVKLNALFLDVIIVNKDDLNVVDFFNNVSIKDIDVIKRCRIIVMHDAVSKKIYKYSCGESSREIIRNYKELGSSSCLKKPRGLNLISTKYSALSSEEYIESDLIKIDLFEKEIASVNLCKIMFKALDDYHSESLIKMQCIFSEEINEYDFLIEDHHRHLLDNVKSKFNTLYSGSSQAQLYKSKIHGDVTYRNILHHDENLYFIDFERSRVDFPEFDSLNFMIDLTVHQSGNASYMSYIDYLIDVYLSKQYVKVFSDFHDMKNPNLYNVNNQEFVYLKFLIRQICIVTNVSYYCKGINIELIYDSILDKLDSKG
jgi:tRNA A-37 threonylcarbamoyl transferase component Bud32